MVIVVILAILLGLVLWILVSSIVMEVDTREPFVKITWISIGNVMIWFDGEWKFRLSILFFHHSFSLSQIAGRKKSKKKTSPEKQQKKKKKPLKYFFKAIRVLKTFRVTEWQLAIDTGDFCRNGRLYPLNYLPTTFGHLHINFNDQNYLHLKTKNRPWKILYAFIRK